MFYSCIFLSQCVLCIKNNDFYNFENYFSNHKSVFQIPLSIKRSLYDISEHEQKIFILLIILSSGCKGQLTEISILIFLMKSPFQRIKLVLLASDHGCFPVCFNWNNRGKKNILYLFQIEEEMLIVR